MTDNPWDAFPRVDAAPAGSGDPWEAFPRVEAAPAASGDPWEAFPRVEAASPAPATQGGWTATARDVATAIPAGLTRGAVSLAGLPADLGGLIQAGVNWGQSKVQDRPLADIERENDAKAVISRDALFKAGGAAMVKRFEDAVTGPIPHAQTLPGKFVERAAEFVPAALAGPGGALRSAINFGIIPGLASEGAGQLTEGTVAEPWARGGAAVLAGGGAALLNGGGAAAGAVARATKGATPQELQAAETLFSEAQAAGAPITRFESLQHVTGGGTRAGDVQRVVEGQGGLRDFFAGRPASNETAARRVFDDIGPASDVPSGIGPKIAEAAKGEIDHTRDVINTVSEPFYDRAALVQLSPQVFKRVQAAPGWAEARDAVRSDPQLARWVQGLPDNSVGFLNEVKKHLDTAAENAAGPMNANRNMQRAAGYGSDAAVMKQAAENASPDYAQALRVQRMGREKFLDPLMQGPIGKLAKQDLTTRQAIEALFPSNPAGIGAQEVGNAVRALAKRNPTAARQLVRAHVESTFNEASQRLQSGANQFGGAGFAAVLRGNSAQAANLEAAIKALPNGDKTFFGFDKFLNIMEAQGTRQRIGSQTAFNQEMQRELKTGSLGVTGATLAGGGAIKWPAKLLETMEGWRLGRNVDKLAKVATDPQGAALFQRLATTGGRQAVVTAIRIAGLGLRGANPPPKLQ